VRRVVSSSSARCVGTVDPYATQARLRLRLRDSLSEEGFEQDPSGACHELDKLLRKARPAALCSHGPVLPTLLARLTDAVDATSPDADLMREHLGEAGAKAMHKGEVLVCHVAGAGPDARVVDVERIDT
jgi:8-oxo-dGTP diphosphatase